jgi:uncharacterized protein YuzE
MSEVYVYLDRIVRRVAATREVAPNVNIDYDEFGFAVGVEILGANGITVDGTEVGS